MRVPLLDLGRQYGELKTEVFRELERHFDTGSFILGPDVEHFEKDIASYLNVNHAIGVTSGTDALFMSLKALGVGPGDRVLTTPFTFFATISAIMNAGAKPVFADIDPDTFNVDPAAVESVLKRDESRTIKAMIPVHLYGQSADMGKLSSLADKYHVPMIEDAAQAIGTRFRGQVVGGIGQVGCFSFFPTKNLGALGDGGLVCTQDGELAERLRLLRNHGSKIRYYHEMIGGNFRLDAMQASVLRIFLRHLDSWIEARCGVAAYYDEALRNCPEFDPPKRINDSTHTFHQYTIRVKNGGRDKLQAYLNEKGIGNSIYYPVPCHLQNALGMEKYEKGSFPVAEAAASEVISLPIYPNLTRENQDIVITALKNWARGA